MGRKNPSVLSVEENIKNRGLLKSGVSPFAEGNIDIRACRD